MSLIDRLKGLFGGQDRTFEYWCTNCETAFDSHKADMSTVSCPECGDTRIRASATVDATA